MRNATINRRLSLLRRAYQARVLFRYVKGLLKRPMLARLVVRETATEIELNTNASIEIMTAGQNVRGYTMAAAICDEIAYWPSSELCAEPDREVLSALRPALSTLRGKLICVSTPYRQVGVLYEAFRSAYGRPGPTLVWKAGTQQMNPTFDTRAIEREIARDPEGARAASGVPAPPAQRLMARREDAGGSVGRAGFPTVARARPVKRRPMSTLRSSKRVFRPPLLWPGRQACPRRTRRDRDDPVSTPDLVGRF